MGENTIIPISKPCINEREDVPPHGMAIGNPAKLHSFVCFCCRKLDKIVEENDNSIIYHCEHCNKKVEIKK